MTNLHLVDHLFALIVIVAFPIYSKLTISDLLKKIEEQGEAARIKAYQHVILTWMAFAAIVVATWIYFERDWGDLGIRMPEPVPLVVSLLAAIAATAAFVIPLRKLAKSRVAASQLDSQLGDVASIMPETDREELWFRAVSTNAGVTEELIFRGWLIWYLSHFMGIGAAAAIAVLAFGLAHLYQGVRQLPALLIVSAVAVGLFIYTKSLLIPVLFHIILDGIQGYYIAKIRQQANSD